MVKLESAVGTTDGDGAFRLSGLPEEAIGRISVSSPDLVTRETRVYITLFRSGLALDVIPADFLSFYRMFVRDGHQNSFYKPLARWADEDPHPSFYINTVLVDTGEEVPAEIIADITRVFTNSVPELTAGRFRVGTIETGDQPRPRTFGWINVTFRRSFPDGRLGQAFVGANPGTIEVVYDPDLDALGFNNPSQCRSLAVATADHEIVHAMGFYHTDRSADFRSGLGCPGAGRPERVRRAAAIAYSRPLRNQDPDIDPAATLLGRSDQEGSPAVAVCAPSHFR